jgi:class 3 adenylate cyclase
MDAPPIHYARTRDDLDLAYLTHGDGPVDLVLIPGNVSHLELWWERPEHARFVDRLAAFARVIQFDKRGTGMSGRAAGIPDLETRVDDLRVILDAIGSAHAAILGNALDGTALAAMFVATHPERSRQLVLWGAAAKGRRTPDYPWGESDESLHAAEVVSAEHWGRSSMVSASGMDDAVPSWANDDAARTWAARYFRNAATPGEAAAFNQMLFELDVRDVLPAVAVPSLVLARDSWGRADLEQARYVASLVPDARYVVLPGSDYPMWLGDQEPVVAEVQEFVTGIRPQRDADRILATVLFTDIVGSTELASSLGDARWRETLMAHHERIRSELARHRGTEIKTTGDGVVATFDGPARAVRCALAIRDTVRPLELDIRAGIHTGEIEVLPGDIGGMGVHIAARVAALAGGSDVLVSSTVKDLTVGSGLTFEDAGEHELKGVPDRWRLYRVVA